MKLKFETWKFGGLRFLAVPNGTEVSIIDENGGNYGSWYSVESYRNNQNMGKAIARPLLGTVGNVRFFNTAE